MINNAGYPNLYTDHNGHLCLLYSSYQTDPNTKWKLKAKNLVTNITTNIETPKHHTEYGAIVAETHPHYRLDNQNRLNLCYVAEFQHTDIVNRHALCYVLTKDLSFKFTDYINLNIVKPTSVGYLGQNKTIYYSMHPENSSNEPAPTPPLNPKNQLVVLQNANSQTMQFTDFRITEILDIKLVNNHNQYLLTTSNAEQKIKTYLLNQNLQIVQEVVSRGGSSIMFGSMLDNNLAYTIMNEYNIPCIELENNNL